MKRRSFLNKGIGLGVLLITPKDLLSCSKHPENIYLNNNNVNKTINEFENRKDILLRNTAGINVDPVQLTDPKADLYSNRAITNLFLKRNINEANKRIRHTARWFEHPHPTGRHINGECDFAAIKLCRAAYLFLDKPELEHETRKLIEEFFLTQNFESIYTSENHSFIFHTSRYLMAQMLSNKQFMPYNKSGSTLLIEDGKWLKDFLRFRARRGWGEFDSSGYLAVDMEVLLTLFDYSADSEMKELAEMMMNLLLADISVDSLNGMHCGAHGRIYTSTATDHAFAGLMPFQFLYFGLNKRNMNNRSTYIDPLVSNFRPDKIVVDIALNRPRVYENFERKHLHNPSDIKPNDPLKGSIRKYTYYTPKYVMGTVQFQDHYPEDSPGKWYAYHQQHNWDLTSATSTRSKIFTHHPGDNEKHNYWTGDCGCECGTYFQHGSAVICLYNIPEKQPYHFIHAYLPVKEFDEVIEIGGFIFVRSGSSFAALKMLGGPMQWTKEGNWKDREVISPGKKNGTICEVGEIDDFGSFENFRDEIMRNKIVFDPGQMKLSYHSKRNGKLTIDNTSLRLLNDKLVDLDYPLFESPYLKSEWDSGLISLKKDKTKLVLDFRE